MSRLNDFPPRLRASTEHPDIVYTRAQGYYAEHGSPSSKDAVLTLNDGEIAIFEGEPKQEDASISAVYKSGSALVVPTGLVFVRFAPEIEATSQRGELEKLGYRVAQSPPYAQNAAWLRNEDGDAAVALKRIPALEKLPKVENVEPQMLSSRALR
jgi:hypothetical protein